MDAIVLIAAIIMVYGAARYIKRLTDRHNLGKRYEEENDDLDQWLGGV